MILKKRRLFTFLYTFLILILALFVFVRLTAKADSQIGFNEGYGSAVHDNSGSASGTITNAVWKPASECLTGTCLFFDGTGDYVSFGNESSFNFAAATNWTIELWFRTAPISSGTRVLISKYNAVAGYKIYMSSNGKINFGVDDDATWGPDDIATSANRYDDNNWHQISVSKTGTSNITLYIDALKVAQKDTLTATGTLASTANFCVGGDSDCTTNGWLGYIDELKVVVASARTTDQIKTDYQKGVTENGTNVRNGPDTSFLTQGLVGYWKMDETASWSGTLNEVIDSSGNGNHGQAKGATGGKAYQTGAKFGNGGYFDGVDDYISIPDSGTTSLDISGSMTVSAWIYLNRLPSAWTSIVCKGNDITWNYCLEVDPNNKLDFGFWDGGGSHTARSSTTLTATTWYHVTGTIDVVSKTWKFYLNGQLDGSDTETGTPPTNNIEFDIGSYNGGGVSEFFPGKIDEVRVYNRALSPAEVSQLYNWAPGPVGWWKFDEGSWNGSVGEVKDSSGNNNNGKAYHGATIAPGKFGNAGYFNSTLNQYLVMNDSDLLDGGNGTTDRAFSGSAWIYVTKQDHDIIFQKGDEYLFYLNLSGYLSFYPTDISAGGIICRRWGTSLFPINSWHHVAFTYNGSMSANGIKLYVDGIRKDDTDCSSGSYVAMEDSTKGFVVGTDSDPSPNYPFNGYIDEVKFYNYVRTPSQIIEDMNAGHPAPGSPVGSALGQWSFNEGYGDTAHNSGSSGTTLDGNLAGSGGSCPGASACPTWTNSGKFGKALSFDGTNDLITTGDVDATSQITLSAWIYPTSTSTDRGIISKRAPTESNGDWAFRFSSTGSNQLEFITWNGLGTSQYTHSSTLNTNTWYYVAVTFDNDTNTTKIYINGILDRIDTKNTYDIADNPEIIQIGYDGQSSYFSGIMDDVRYYDSVLTADQIKLLYNQGSAAALGALSDTTGLGGGSAASNSASAAYCVPGDTSTCNPPVGEWKLDENSGTTANDTSGNNLSGSLGGGDAAKLPTWTPGKSGSALSFDGSNDYVGISGNIGLNGVTKFTFGAWIKRRLVNSYVTLGDQNCGTGKSATIEAMQDGKIDFTVGDGTPTIGCRSGKISSNDTNWHHVMYVFDGTLTGDSNRLKVYLDGVQQTVDFTGGGSIPASATVSTTNFEIGDVNTGGGVEATNGIIDNVLVYNYARTPSQIAWDMNRGAPVAWYRFDECTDTAAYDAAPKADDKMTRYDGYIRIGNAPPQNAIGTCIDGMSAHAWYNGRNGKINASINLDGSDDYIYTNSAFSPLASAGSSVTKVSWGGWFNPATSVASKTLIEKASEFRLVTDSSGNPVCGAFPFTSASAATASAALGLSTWSHVTCTYDGSNIIVFVNGNPVAVKPYTNSITAASSILYMGGSSDGSQFYQGQLDDIRLYNYSLTQVQIKTLYNTGSAFKF